MNCAFLWPIETNSYFFNILLLDTVCFNRMVLKKGCCEAGMKKEVCLARFCKAVPPEKRPFVKRSIDESGYCVEFVYLGVCH